MYVHVNRFLCMYTVHRLLWLPASKRRSHQCYHLCKSVRNPFCVCPSVTLLDSHSCRPNSSNRVHCDSFHSQSEWVCKHLIVSSVHVCCQLEHQWLLVSLLLIQGSFPCACASTQTARHADFVVFPSSKISSTTKQEF